MPRRGSAPVGFVMARYRLLEATGTVNARPSLLAPLVA